MPLNLIRRSRTRFTSFELSTASRSCSAAQSRRRVRRPKTSAVVIPSSHPITAVARMIQTSEALVEPNAQLSFTVRVFTEISTIRTTSSPTIAKALV